jgi:spore germination protein KC
MTKRRLCAAVLAFALLLTGCWSRLEVNDLGMVVSLGVDRVEANLLEVTLSIALPCAASSGKAQPATTRRPRIIVKRRGRTIAEAIRLVELSSPRRIRLDHANVVLLGERFGREGIDHLIDFLMRSPQMRLSGRIVMVEGVTPGELLEQEPIMRTTQAEALRELENGRAGIMMKLKDFFIARAHAHIAPILSVARLRPHATNESGAPSFEMELAGAVVFKADRVAFHLDAEEARAVNWLLTSARNAVVTSPCPGGGPGHVSAEIAETHRKIIPSWDGRRFAFRVELGGHLSLTDLQCHMAISGPEQVQALQDVLQKQLKTRMTNVIRKTQENRADPFAFGEIIRAKYPELWAQKGEEH